MVDIKKLIFWLYNWYRFKIFFSFLVVNIGFNKKDVNINIKIIYRNNIRNKEKI